MDYLLVIYWIIHMDFHIQEGYQVSYANTVAPYFT